MKNQKLTKDDIICLIIFILLIIVAVALVVLRIWVFITYANTPVGDIPMWAIWLLGEHE